MTDDQRHGRQRQDRSRAPRLAGIFVGALVAGAGFGVATSLANAAAHSYADLESEDYTTSGWSIAEVVSVLLDSGWAWAGLAVVVGWLACRAGADRPAALARAAAAGALALLAATAAYSVAETLRSSGPLSSWYMTEPLVWWVTSVIFGAPLGSVGECIARPGVIGLLARLTVPVGAAVQMIVLPLGRNELIAAIGKTIVWAAAAVSIGVVVIRFLGAQRRRRSPAAAESP